MRIGELAKKTGASERSLRYYEERGLISGRRLANGYRDFAEAQTERVRAARFYLSLGLTIEEVERILNCDGSRPPEERAELYGVCEPLLALYREKLEEMDEQMAALSEVRRRLEERISLFEEHRVATRSPPG